jgi:GT2 family glycosyltransferase/tetratricopeptide (TPR) repeat protein
MVSIIIATFNNLEYTQQCLESVEAFTPEEHEVIFVDNGSTDGTWQWIRMQMFNHPEYKLIKSETNQGFPVAMNQGAEIAQGEYLCFLNNDTVLSKEWLTGLLECHKSAPDIGIVGPRLNYVSGWQQVNDGGGYDTIFKYIEYAESYRKTFKGLWWPHWRIVPIVGLIKRDTFLSIGRFDERFSPGNFEDDDLCLRLCLAGYRNLICSDVFIHHHGSATCKDMDFANLLETNKKKFEDKWEPLTGKTISAVMIVKDEEANIRKCIDAIYPLVDEIVVVDTGSTDLTKIIATSYDDKVKVYEIAWCDDFSAARNFANSKATKDWILSIDADEVITGLDKINLRPFHAYRITTRTYNEDPLLANCVDNTGEYPEEKGTRWFPSTKVRLWPRDPRIVFEYPIHEVVENSVYFLGMQLVECAEAVVHHYGRMTPDYDTKRGEKYFELIQKQMESGKNDSRSLEQLALQCQALLKWEDARKFWHELLKIEPSNNMAIFNLGHCYAEEEMWAEALEWSKKALIGEPENRDILMNVATCEVMAGDIKLAEKMCADLLVKYPSYPLPQGLLNAMEINKQAVLAATGGKKNVRSKVKGRRSKRKVQRRLRHR